MSGKTILLRSLAVGLGLAVIAATLGTTTSANAHSGEPPTGSDIVCPHRDRYVYVCFEQDGDDLWVYDALADGASAEARWFTNYDRVGTCRNSHGAGTWHECDYDFRENALLFWNQWVNDADDASRERKTSGPHTVSTTSGVPAPTPTPPR